MIIDHKLTFKQKTNERKKLIVFSFFNGLSSACISVNILSLFLIQAGFSTTLVTITTSFVNVGTIAVLFSKILISRYGAAKTMFISWLLKGMIAFLLALTPLAMKFLPGDLIIFLLLLFAFMFYMFRAFGNPAMQPLFADLTTNDNRGRFTAITFLNYNIAMFITLISFFLFFHFSKGFTTLQTILICGAIANIISSLILFQVNESPYSEQSSNKFRLPFLVKMLGRDKNIRRFFIARGLSVTLGSLIISVSIIALKYIYNIPNSIALLFIIIELLGSIGVSYISKIISEYTGPKPLMLIYAIGNVVISLLWILAPRNLDIVYLSIIFLAGGITGTGLTTSSFHYFLLVVPQKKSVGYSLLFSVTTGLIGIIIGIVIGGGAIQVLTLIDLSTVMKFRIFYILMAVLSIPIIYMISTLKSSTHWRITDVFGLLFSPRDMRILYSINKIEKFASLQEEIQNVTDLEFVKSNLSEKALLYYLNSPHLLLRIKALHGLSHHKLTKSAHARLIKELEHGEFSTGFHAAYIIGTSKIRTAIPLLRKSLDSNDYYLQGHSMIALAKMADRECYDKIKRILIETEIPIILLCSSIALTIFRSEDLPVLMFYKLIHVKCPTIIRYELLFYIARSLGVGDEFYRYIRLYQENREEATYWLLDLLKLDSMNDQLLENYYKNKIPKSEILKFFSKAFDRTNMKLDSFIEAINLTSEDKIFDEIIYLMFVLLLNKENRSKTK